MNKKVKIIVFDLNGKRIKSFKSIHKFRQLSKYGHLSKNQLVKIKKGELIWAGKLIIGSEKYRSFSRINPLRCKYIYRKIHRIKYDNINKLYILFKQKNKIIVIDNTFKILKVHSGTIKSLANKEKKSEGTIKSSLARAYKEIKNRDNMMPAKYYVYIKDLDIFLKNIQKSFH